MVICHTQKTRANNPIVLAGINLLVILILKKLYVNWLFKDTFENAKKRPPFCWKPHTALVFTVYISVKCLERIVYNAIYSYVSSHLSEWQHGFVKGRSCETQLRIESILNWEFLIENQWARALDEGRQVDVAFLAFFDRVSHPVFLEMLCSFGFSGSILQWCESYLSQRQQRVVLEGVSSSSARVSSGVPHSSLSGPLFFVIFIRDLPDVVLPGNTIALYAGDCKSFRIIDSALGQNTFQEDLDNLHQWSLPNFMDFNVKKCKIISSRPEWRSEEGRLFLQAILRRI